MSRTSELTELLKKSLELVKLRKHNEEQIRRFFAKPPRTIMVKTKMEHLKPFPPPRILPPPPKTNNK